MLGPILFLVYINDLPEVVHNAKLFADDTKLYGKSCTDEDQRSIQEDINSLIQWSDSWLLKFNISKCKHMHLGTRNTQTVYKMDGMDIEQTTCEKDLGVYIDNELKFQRHIAESIKKANQKLGIIKRNFSHLDKDSFLSLYKSLVRPHLEYCSCVWSVIYKKDAISIENTQRRATKLVHHIQHLPYSDRLRYLGLPSLEYRRIRTDVIQLYKIVNNIDRSERSLFDISSDHRTRGHSLRIKKQHCRLNIRQQSFTQRVVNIWNSLPESVVNATSVNSFKNQLIEHWKRAVNKFEPSCLAPVLARPVIRQNIEMYLEGHPGQ